MSYSGIKFIKAIINKHNSNILNENNNCQADSCNCSDKVKCPLRGNCLINNVIYHQIR